MLEGQAATTQVKKKIVSIAILQYHKKIESTNNKNNHH